MNNKYKYIKIKEQDSDNVKKYMTESSINYTLSHDPMALVCENFAEEKLEHEVLYDGEYEKINNLTDYLYSQYINNPEGEVCNRELLDSIYNRWCTIDSFNK